MSSACPAHVQYLFSTSVACFTLHHLLLSLFTCPFYIPLQQIHEDLGYETKEHVGICKDAGKMLERC